MRAFKSVAERTRLQTLTRDGGFPRQSFEAMVAASEGLDLPERLIPKKGSSEPKTVTKLSAGRSTRYDGMALAPKGPTHY
jgi:hypothetical protein